MRFLFLIVVALAVAGCGARPDAGQATPHQATAADVVPSGTINPGADIEIVMRSPSEMRAMMLEVTGFRAGRGMMPYSVSEAGPRGLSRIYLLGSDRDAPMIRALIGELGRGGALDAQRFAESTP